MPHLENLLPAQGRSLGLHLRESQIVIRRRAELQIHLLGVVLTTIVCGANYADEPPKAGLSHGPFIGHLTSTTATIWARGNLPADYACVIANMKDGPQRRITASARSQGDHCVVWTFKSVGYELVELITSPMHDGIIEAANAPHPDLLFDVGEPHSFLLLTADTRVDPPILTGELQNAAGKVLYEITLSADELSRE